MPRGKRRKPSAEAVRAAAQGIRLNNYGVLLELGTSIEAKDTAGQWFSAKIIDLNESENKVMVHFDRWNKRFDEWLALPSLRIRKRGTQLDDIASRITSTNVTKLKAGDVVVAEWYDKKYYPVTVIGRSLDSKGVKYTVRFDDNDNTEMPGVSASQLLVGGEAKKAISGHDNNPPPKPKTVVTKTKKATNKPTGKRAVQQVKRRSSSPKIPLKASKNAKVTGDTTSEIPQADDSRKRPSTSVYSKRKAKVVSETPQPAAVATPKRGRKPAVNTPLVLVLPATPSGTTESSDHNAFKCDEEGCNKSFRKQSLLESHMKYYHTAAPTPEPKKAVKKPKNVNPTPKKSTPRRKSITMKRKRKQVVDHQPSAQESLVTTTPKKVAVPKTSSTIQSPSNESVGSQGVEPEAVTRCICGHEDESEFMIQCERCNTWQHGACLGIGEKEPPIQYRCFSCMGTMSAYHNAASGRHGKPLVTYFPALRKREKQENAKPDELQKLDKSLLGILDGLQGDSKAYEDVLLACRLNINRTRPSTQQLKSVVAEQEEMMKKLDVLEKDLGAMDEIVETLATPLEGEEKPNQKDIDKIRKLYARYNSRNAAAPATTEVK